MFEILPDEWETGVQRSLNWVYTICSCLSVSIFRFIMVRMISTDMKDAFRNRKHNIQYEIEKSSFFFFFFFFFIH